MRCGMARYGLGVDTGGTFTDAVILDLSDYSLIAKAKSPTTHHDLSIGLYESVRKVFDSCDVKPSDISLAGISTTLATNSVLEGKGGDVGLIFIGWDIKKPVNFGEKNQAFIKGGYDSKGKMVEPVNEDEAKEAILRVSKGVDAIAISGLFSVMNPSQERMVKDMAMKLTDLPVIVGTELSSTLGVDERARTAVLNGRLISIVKMFFDGLEKTFRGMGITAPIMVYKGDGSVMSIDKARKYPVESVFSGPAASSVGGRITSGLEDFIMIDIGGTSTDVALVEKGMPEIQKEGANICGWRTHVKAVDMYTVALGGDSLIKLQDMKIDLGNGIVIPFFSLSRYKSFNFTIGPERVIPLSVFARDNPSVIDKIRRTCICEYYLMIKEPDPENITDRCAKVVTAMRGKGPMNILEIRDASVGLWSIDEEVRYLKDSGYVVLAGLTPSDLMVYRGCFDNGDPEGSRAGISALAEVLRMDRDKLVERLLDMIHSKISEAIMSRLLDERLGNWRSKESMGFMRELISKKKEKGFTLLPRIDVPIVGIGAPTKHLMGDVGERLGTELIFPENGDVGNAIGAVCSKMVASLTAVIQPTEDGGFRVTIPFSGTIYKDRLEDSMAAAQAKLKSMLESELRSDGATNISVMFKSKYFSSSEDGIWSQSDIDHADLIARATGDPPGLN